MILVDTNIFVCLGFDGESHLDTIGAHALVEGLTLLTRDPRRYRSYFPDLRLIAPA